MSDLFADRLPPHNHEAEQAVLGSILIEPSVLMIVNEQIRAEDFYRQAHQRLFQVMNDLAEQGKPVDLVTLTSELQDRKLLEEVGGVPYLTELAGTVPTAANAEYYAKIVEEKALLRRLIRTATQIAATGYAGAEDIPSVLNEAEKKILEISQRRIRGGGFIPIRDALMESYEQIENLHFNKSGITGTPTGFVDLDRMTSGLKGSELIIIAARPAMGKTAFALNLAQNVAVRSNQTVALFNLEMSAPQLVMRMLAAEGNIDAQAFRTGNLNDEDWEKLTMAMSTLSEAPIFIDDTPGVTVFDIRSKLRRLQAEHGLGLVVIDYLQLITGRGESRQQEISEISRSLKLLAREFDVPVIALSQLSRAVEQRQDKRPMLSDLRESGSIEQDADLVAFLYRDDYYNEDSEKKNIAELIIGKQRSGPVGKVELLFLRNYNKFLSLDTQHKQFSE